jgi:hypothetical protein
MDARPPEPPLLTIVGDKVALGSLHRDLLPLCVRWFNDLEYAWTTSSVRPVTAEAVAASYDRDSRDPRQVHFAVYERTTWCTWTAWPPSSRARPCDG